MLILGLVFVIKKSGLLAPKPSLSTIETNYLQLYNKILLSSNLSVSEIKNFDLIPYKFYFKLTSELLVRFIKFGFQIREPITELRIELKKDLDQEKQTKRIESESVFQFFVVMIMTWFMILMTSWQADLIISKTLMMIILSWQTTGLIFFYFFKARMRQKLFGGIHYVICRVLYWKSLLSVGLPISEVFKTKTFNWNKNFKGELLIIVKRLEQLVKETLKTGQPIKQELRYFMDELWFHYNDQGNVFKESLTKLRFICLILFFLPCYFVFVYFMLSTFTEQF